MKFLAWFSCGVTSAVACKLAIDKYGDDVDIWYIETGAAHSDNQRFIEDCENWYGRKILTARHPKFKNPLEIAAIEVFNTPWGAPCTKYLKKEVRQRIEKNYTQPITYSALSIIKKKLTEPLGGSSRIPQEFIFRLLNKGGINGVACRNFYLTRLKSRPCTGWDTITTTVSAVSKAAKGIGTKYGQISRTFSGRLPIWNGKPDIPVSKIMANNSIWLN